MPRKKQLINGPITLRLTDAHEALLAEVQVWAAKEAGVEDDGQNNYGRAPTVRRILDAVITAMRTDTPMTVLLPIEIARLLPPVVASP